jgi:hypothetical protein
LLTGFLEGLFFLAAMLEVSVHERVRFILVR